MFYLNHLQNLGTLMSILCIDAHKISLVFGWLTVLSLDVCRTAIWAGRSTHIVFKTAEETQNFPLKFSESPIR